mmetsp:Transcript_65523/g.156683  ORF Transcript_65523/g.156683 Transcript_65523/m.156683 type:complete len:429 (+) Transcript_65523:75-1361(+)
MTETSVPPSGADTAHTEMRRRSRFHEQLVIVLLMASIVATGTLNNFVSRMRAELLGKYNFAVVVPDAPISLTFNLLCLGIAARTSGISRAQFSRTFRCGRSWSEMGLWKYMVLASCSDSINLVTGLASQPYLTTLMMSLMDQATTPFTVICSLAMLGTRYTLLESVAVVVVACCAVACVLLARKDGGENSFFWAIFAAVTTAFAAFSFVLKEMAFREFLAESKLLKSSARASIASSESTAERGQTSLSGSGLAQPLTHPAASGIPATHGQEAGAEDADFEPERLSVFLMACVIQTVNLFVCIPSALLNQVATSDEPAIPTLITGVRMVFSTREIFQIYALTMCINFGFNLSLLALTGRASALLAFLSLKLVVPFTAVLSPLPWPIIGSKSVPAAEWLALAVMMLGISGFRVGTIQRERKGLNRCCWPF